MQTVEQLLTEHPFFNEMPSAYRELIAGCSASGTFAPGDFILREGDYAATFYLVRHGRVPWKPTSRVEARSASRRLATATCSVGRGSSRPTVGTSTPRPSPRPRSSPSTAPAFASNATTIPPLATR